MTLNEKEMDAVLGLMHQQGFRIFIEYLSEKEAQKIKQMKKCRKEDTVKDKLQYLTCIDDILQFFRMCKTQVAEHTEQSAV